MRKKKDIEKAKARVHEDLKGFELSVDQFGEIKSNFNIEEINTFLDKNVSDKKLTDRAERRPRKARKKKG